MIERWTPRRVVLETALLQERFRELSETYFHEFIGPFGARARLDQDMDRGPEYRNLVGWPGGMSSPLWPIFEAANTHGMELRAGSGNDADLLNVVWVMDSDAYPYFAGEQFHQYHSNFFNSPGMPYPDTYTDGLWRAQMAAGIIGPTGCPEESHWR